MAANQPCFNNKRFPSIVAASGTIDHQMLDDRYQARNTSNSLTAYTPFESQIASQGLFSPSYPTTFETDHYLARTNPTGPFQDSSVVPVSQASFSSPYSSMLRSGSPGVNAQEHHSFGFSGNEGISSNMADRPAQYNFDGVSNTGYTDPSCSLHQPTIPTSRLEIFSDLATASKTSAKPYLCSFGCGRSFTRKGDMERHAKSHGERNLWCSVSGCHSRFYRTDKLKEHVKKWHEKH